MDVLIKGFWVLWDCWAIEFLPSGRLSAAELGRLLDGKKRTDAGRETGEPPRWSRPCPEKKKIAKRGDAPDTRFSATASPWLNSEL